MPFLKHHLVFHTESELNKVGWSHVQSCSLKEIAFSGFPKTHNYVIRHKGLYAFPAGYAAAEMGWSGEDRRVTDGGRWPKDIIFQGSLKTSLKQDEAFETTLAALEESPFGGATLCLPPGYGKTVVALAMLSTLKRKAFVLVHTKFLAEQWRERIEQFLPGLGVFMWDSSSEQDADRDCSIGIGLMQTIHRLPSFFFSNYGVLVVDECHHVACQTLQQCVPRFNTRYTIGLSATPKRKDGLTQYLYWMLGPISFHIEPKYKGVQALIAKYDNTAQNKHMLQMLPDESLENRIVCDHARLEFTTKLLEKVLKDGDRRVLVLTLRRKHAEMMMEEFEKLKVVKGKMILGGMSFAPSELAEFNVIVSTFQLVSEGFDCPHLNTILCAMPKGDLVQVIGRVTRGGIGKLKPWIVDIVDTNEFDALQKFRRRRTLYRQLEIELIE